VLVYFAVLSITHYAYFADTTGYVQNILLFDRNAVAARSTFWDFGHLLWRPSGWLLFRVFGGLVPYTKTGESNLTVAALLIAVSVISGLVTVLLFRSLAARFLTEWAATFVAIAFLCFYAFLNYFLTATSYVIGIMWLTISL
jgi:hypothetical protein